MTHEIITKFKSSPDSDISSQTTKRTIVKSKDKSVNDVIIDEILEETPTEIPEKSSPMIEEIETLPLLPEHIEELPEEVHVLEKVSEDGKSEKQIIKKRVIKKHKGGKQEKTEIVTVEEEGKEPKSTVTIQELLEDEDKPTEIQELPQEVQVIEEESDEGTKIQKKIKKRVIRKRKGDKHEATEIVTVEESGKEPQTTVTTKEIKEDSFPFEPQEIEELPEHVHVIEQVKPDGQKVKKTIKKRVIKKRLGDKHEETKIITVEEEGKEPETTVSVEEITEDVPEIIEESPEQVQIIEETKLSGEKTKKLIKKRVIKKHKGGKQEATEITTVEEEGKTPEMTVTVEEIKNEQPEITYESPEKVEIVEEIKDGRKIKKTTQKRITKKQSGENQKVTEIVTVEEEGKKPKQTIIVEEIPNQNLPDVIEELPEEIKITEKIQPSGEVIKKIVKKRVIKKPKGDRQEATEIITVEETGKEPQTTITVQELEHESFQPQEIQELPEEIKILEEIKSDGKKVQKLIKRRVILKRKDGKKEATEIVTIEEEGKQPETSIVVEEIVDNGEPLYPQNIEELPEEVKVIEEVKPDGKTSKRIIKKRVLQKTKDGKKESTEIVTVKEDGKSPETTVTIKEIKYEKPEEILEMPERIKIIETNEDGKTIKKTVKKRVIHKKKGDKVEKTEIVTVEEEGKIPEVALTVQNLPDEEITLVKPQQI